MKNKERKREKRKRLDDLTRRALKEYRRELLLPQETYDDIKQAEQHMQNL